MKTHPGLEISSRASWQRGQRGIAFSAWSGCCMLRRPCNCRSWKSCICQLRRNLPWGLLGTLTTRSRLPMTWHMCDLGALQCQHWKPPLNLSTFSLTLGAKPYDADVAATTEPATDSCPRFRFPSEPAREGCGG